MLVQAAGSGVSSAAIQIAKMLGARVITTTSTDEKAARARELGADEVINYTKQDFVAECKRLTDKKGVDVVIEHVGGEVFAKSILAAAWGGRVVTCGATTGFTPTIDLRHVFFRQVEVLGSTMGPKGDLFGILRHVEAGKLDAGGRPRPSLVERGRGAPAPRGAEGVREDRARGGLRGGAFPLPPKRGQEQEQEQGLGCE